MSEFKYKSEVKGKCGIIARVVADSVSEQGKRITTFEVIHHRWILAEINKHRMLSNNYQSSRAVPVSKILEQIRNAPATPVFWGKNQAGMQAKEGCTNRVGIWDTYHGTYDLSVEDAWYRAACQVSDMTNAFSEAGYHKQTVNRLAEPFMMVKGVITATEWDNFFYLRRHKDAQPELQELADCMWEALQLSTPELLKEGEWHTPYVEHYRSEKGELNYIKGWSEETGEFKLKTSEVFEVEQAKKISSTSCAQVSFRKLDQAEETVERVWDRLINGEQPHCYDNKTEVLTYQGFKNWADVTVEDLIAVVDEITGQFLGYDHPKKIISEVYEGRMYKYDQKDYNLCVTPNHRMYGSLISKAEDRKVFNPKIFKANDTDASKSSKTLGEREFRALRCPLQKPFEFDLDYLVGSLGGFAVGDGYIKKGGTTLKFHLKKTRKVEFLTSLLGVLKVEFTTYKLKDGTYEIKIVNSLIKREDIYTESGDKKLPKLFRTSSTSFKKGLLNGLRNSDGTSVNNTWQYSTNSEQLKNEFEELCILTGEGATNCVINTKEGYKPVFTLRVMESPVALVNDSRKNKVELVDYVGKVYCADMGGKLLITRREGKTAVSGNSVCMEHIATPTEYYRDTNSEGCFISNIDKLHHVKGLSHVDVNGNLWSGNFQGWIQFRKQLPNEACWKYEGN